MTGLAPLSPEARKRRWNFDGELPRRVAVSTTWGKMRVSLRPQPLSYWTAGCPRTRRRAQEPRDNQRHGTLYRYPNLPASGLPMMLAPGLALS